MAWLKHRRASNPTKERIKMTPTKAQIIEAGTEMMNRSTPAQQSNHVKVLAWIGTLDESTIPSTTDASTTYKCLIREWVAIVVNGQPKGTGNWFLPAKQTNPQNQ